MIRAGPPTKKPGPALTTRDTGERLEHSSSYRRSDELQSAGMDHAEHVHEIAERFISSFYRAITDSDGEPMCAALQRAVDANLELSPDVFPSTSLAHIVALLCDFAENEIKPTAELILTAARGHGICIMTGGGDEVAELRQILECECSAAGIQNYARLLSIAHRRRVQAARLWRALRDRVGNPFGEGPRTDPRSRPHIHFAKPKRLHP